MADSLITVDTAASIRTAILNSLRTRYLSLGFDIAIDVDSDAYSWADSLSIPLEGIEARALVLANQIFPDTSTEDYVVKHGDLIGMPRKPATGSVVTMTVSGTPASTFLTSDILISQNGQKFAPTAGGTVGGGGTVTVNAQAVDTGTITTQAVGTLLTWATPPTGIDATATINAVVSPGTDEELIEDYAARIMDWWRERPGAGNRADFKAWAESRTGVDKAYVYPMDHASLGPGTLGAVIVSIQGDASQRTVDSPLGVGSGNTTDVSDYILGAGAYVADGRLLPAFFDANDLRIEIPTLEDQDVVAQIILGTGYSFPFAGTFTKATNGSNSTTRVYVTATPVGTIEVGDLVAIDTTASGASYGAERGAYQVRTVSVVNSAYIEVSEPLGNIPDDGKLVRPAPDNWENMRDAVLAVFDRLGPKDEATASSARFPDTTIVGPSTLYKAALTASLMSLPGLNGAPSGVAGVASANVTTPASDVVPTTARYQLRPRVIYFTA